ncbi:unnamed protein product, partial [Pylaiella littoralis]
LKRASPLSSTTDTARSVSPRRPSSIWFAMFWASSLTLPAFCFIASTYLLTQAASCAGFLRHR